MLGKYTKQALIGGLVLLASTVLATTAFAEASVSGYIKFDATLDLQSPSGSTDFQVPPVAGSQKDLVKGGLSMFVNESRFRFTSSDETDMGKVSTNFEFDVWGTGQAAGNPRVRHAYVTWGPWLFGQTWSTIMTDLFNVNETLDFGGARGVYFVRQPMVRYTMPMDANKLVLAAELSKGNNDAAANVGGDQDPSLLPDIHVAYHAAVAGGKIAAALVLTTYRQTVDAKGADTSSTKAVGEDVTDLTASGTGIAINGRFPVGGKNNVKFAISTGNDGRYMPFSTGAYVSTSTSGKSSLNAPDPITGIVLGYQHWLNDTDRVNFVYGSLTNAIKIDSANYGDSTKTNPNAFGAGTTHGSLHLNWIRSLTKSMKIGVEYGSWTVGYDKACFAYDAVRVAKTPPDPTVCSDSKGKESTSGGQSRIQFSVQAVY